MDEHAAAKKPEVSIIIATYNRAQVLRERALASIEKQTFKNWECIVVDDERTTDNTEAVVRELAAHDPRFRYVKNRAGSQGAARNLGVREARGEYIAFTDDDDAFLPTYLEVCLEEFKKLPKNISYISPAAIGRDAYGNESYILPGLEPFWKFSIGNGWVFRRNVFFEKDLFFDEVLTGFEDTDLYIRFHEAGEKGYVFKEPLRVYYTAIGSGAFSWSKDYDRQRGNFDIFFKKNEAIYRREGGEAFEWLCRFGGVVYCQSGKMADGRKLLMMAFRSKPNFFDLIYYCASFLGKRSFNRFDHLKSKLMRNLRVLILNRLPSVQ